MPGSALRTLQRHTLTSTVYASIKQAILSGELPPGSRVTEKMLADRFGTSHSPVREAMARLAQERYLIGVAHKGYRVNHPTSQEAREIREVLNVLLALGMELAARRADDRKLNELLSCIDEMERGLAAGDVEQYGNAGGRFRHLAMIYSGNETLARLYDQLSNHPAYIRLWAVDDLGAARRRAPDFARLRQALAVREGTVAGQVLAEKMEKALEDVLAELEEPATPGVASASEGGDQNMLPI